MSVEINSRLRLHCLVRYHKLSSTTIDLMLVLFEDFCCYASSLNWILIKRQTELMKRSWQFTCEWNRINIFFCIFFHQRNWLIGLFRSKFLLNYSFRSVDHFKRVLNFRWKSQRWFTHFQRDVLSSKNKVIDAGTQYSGGNKVVRFYSV